MSLVRGREAANLGRLAPLVVDADQTGGGTGETDEAVVETDPAEGRDGVGQVAEIGEELELAGGSLTVKLVRVFLYSLDSLVNEVGFMV